MNLKRDLDVLLRQLFFFFNFNESEILLSESDRGMELIVIVVFLCLGVSRASYS